MLTAPKMIPRANIAASHGFGCRIMPSAAPTVNPRPMGLLNSSKTKPYQTYHGTLIEYTKRFPSRFRTI
jgi:hypothetical protein